jgi:predicted dithiol-disulfide oxidoreductase (DUF899 family)
MNIDSAAFPGESAEYREAREQLLAAEVALRRQIESVAAQRRALPLGGEVATDYEFVEWDATRGKTRTTRLSQLLAPDKDSLFIYNFMFKPGEDGLPLEVPCPICTSIIDGLDGAIRHIEQRVNFAVVTKVPVERLAAHARARGWRHVRLLSSADTTYNRDYRAETNSGEQFAMATVFTRRDVRIHHFWSSELWYAQPEPGQHPRHVDFLWPMWAIFDRTPGGRGSGWMPQLSYPNRAQ